MSTTEYDEYLNWRIGAEGFTHNTPNKPGWTSPPWLGPSERKRLTTSETREKRIASPITPNMMISFAYTAVTDAVAARL